LKNSRKLDLLQNKEMIKTLKMVQKEDIKLKEIFDKKQAYLQERKDKALQNRRNTIKRKNRKRCAKIPTNSSGESKRAKNS